MIDIADAGEIKAKVVIEYDGSGIDKAKEDLASLAESTGGMGGSTEEATQKLADFGTQAEVSAGSAKTLNSALVDLPRIVESGGGAISSATEALDEHRQAVESTAQSISNIQEPLKSYNENLQTISETVSSGHFAENMSAFQNALQDPLPFRTINSYLSETGQSWEDFTSSIGVENSAALEGITKTSTATERALSGMGRSVKETGTAFTESAGSAAAFTEQFNGIGAVAVDAGKAVEETGSAVAEVGGAMRSAGGLGEALSSTMSGMSEFFGGIAMPAMMAMQMVIPMVTQAAQGIYDMAAIAEGPAAHSMGTFTGQVDALGQTTQHVAAQFSESFGQQVIPTINAMNYQMAQSVSTGQDLGGNLGAVSSFMANLGSTIVGPSLMMNPLTFGLGLSMTQAGFAGMINQGASAMGMQEPFQGPGASSQTTYDVVSVVHQQTIQTREQIQTLLEDASNPAFLDQQNQLSAAQQVYQRAQQSYDIRHPINQQQMLMGFQEQQYDQQQAQNYQYQMSQPPEKYSIAQAIGDWWNRLFGGVETPAVPATTSTGCFPAGTRVRMANGTEKAIETLQIGEKVLGHDGIDEVVTTVLALIKPPPKQVYALVFSNGTTLTLTDSHPIATPLQGWKALSVEHAKLENPDLPISPLRVGDSISMSYGICTVTTITPLQGVVQIYNIEVDAPHTFYANNVLVHNKVLNQMATQQIGQQTADQIGAIQLPHIDLSGITAGLASAFGGITVPAIPDIGGEINGALSSMFGGISLPAIPDIGGMLNGALSSMFGGISLPAIPNIGGEISGALSGMFGGIAVPSPPDVGGMIDGAMSGIFGGIQSPTPPDVGGMINGAMSGMFDGISVPTAPNLGAAISGAMSGMFGGISMPSIPFFASGVEGFGGGLAVVGEAGPELVHLPSGSSVYPMTSGAGIGGGSSPISLGGGGGNMPQSINVSVHLDSQAIISAIGLPLSQNIRLASGMRAF